LRRHRGEIDAQEVVKVERVRRDGPCAAEDLRMEERQPQRRPAARGVARYKASGRARIEPHVRFQIGQQFLDQSASPGPVVRAIGELVMAEGSRCVQEDDHEIFAGATDRRVPEARLRVRLTKRSPERVHDVDGGKPALGLRGVIVGQEHFGAHRDRSRKERR